MTASPVAILYGADLSIRYDVPLSRTAGEGGERSEPGEGLSSDGWRGSIASPSPLCVPDMAEEGSGWWRQCHHQPGGRPTDHPLMHFRVAANIAWEPGQRPSLRSPEQLPGLAPGHARQGHADYGSSSQLCRC